MDGATAQGRRYYHHVLGGGALSKEDVARMVVSMEKKDREIEDLKALLRDFIEECPKSVEFGDWPELQELVKRADKLTYGDD